jgi:nitric oxide reductase NorE protein
MWFFILVELTAFALFLLTFATTQKLDAHLFHQGQATLHPLVGIICTLALLTSSYLVALALIQVKRNQMLLARNLLRFAIVVATIYIGAKLWEYVHLAQLGYGISSNDFYTLYYLTTGFHFMHVILGMLILAYMAHRAGKGAYTPQTHSALSLVPVTGTWSIWSG